MEQILCSPISCSNNAGMISPNTRGPITLTQGSSLKIGTIMDKAISQIVGREDTQPTSGRIRVISSELGNET